MKDLVYRRQFLISRKEVTDLAFWKHLALPEGLKLYCHPDLPCEMAASDTKTIVIMGGVFDFESPGKTVPGILADMLAEPGGYDALMLRVKKYSGRYVILYHDKERYLIFSDARGLREIYYVTTSHNKVVCGSQPNLVDDFSDPGLGKNQDKSLLGFYQEMKARNAGNIWVGDETLYNQVKHLMPNHVLDLKTIKPVRYWPNVRLERQELGDAVAKSAVFLKGSLKAITTRHKTMMAITSGFDSRTLLAASRDFVDDIFLFINKEKHLRDNSSDLVISQKIGELINQPVHVIHPEERVDETFKTIFLNNVSMATQRILPTIYGYYKHSGDRVNILGIGEIGRSRFGQKTLFPDEHYLAYWMGYQHSAYAITYMKQWLNANSHIPGQFSVSLPDLSYWENFIGNWGAVGNAESDIAIDEYDPYNSHYLYELFLSVDEKYREYANNVLFKELIRSTWPELLSLPVNPPDNAFKTIKYALKKLKVFHLLKQGTYIAYRGRVACLEAVGNIRRQSAPHGER